MIDFVGYDHESDQTMEEKFSSFKKRHDAYFKGRKRCFKKNKALSFLPSIVVVKIFVSFKTAPFIASAGSYDEALSLCLEKAEQGFLEYKRSSSLKKKRKKERFVRINNFFKFLHKRA